MTTPSGPSGEVGEIDDDEVSVDAEFDAGTAFDAEFDVPLDGEPEPGSPLAATTTVTTTITRTDPAPATTRVPTWRAGIAELRKAGHFEEAARRVREELPPKPAAADRLEAGVSLAAVSDYDAANAQLLLASLDERQAPAALAKLSEVAWVRHDHTRGREYALEGLQLEPGFRGCRIQLRRNEKAEAAANSLGDTSGMVAHAAFHADPHGNAGDLALVDSVRRGFDLEYAPRAGRGLKSPTTHPRWWDVHVHQLFDEKRLAQVNAGDGLVLGGGGLFLPDTAPNGNSGWQWNVTDEMLRRIKVPLVVWGVGYNTFEGQEFDGSRFGRSLRTLVERAGFVGLRNSGSVEKVRSLLPSELADKIRWQPCPTTVISKLGGPAWEQAPDGDGSGGPVLLNCAYDRSARRFGDGYGQFLASLRDWILATRERAEVRYAAHCVDDEIFVNDLRREHGLTLPVIPMYDMTVPEIHTTYRRAALVVGMRGHAGMVPFGCGTPIVSLVSHPKLAFFLADIGREEWGISVHEPDLGPRLRELTGRLLDERASVVEDIERLQQRLFDVTLENLGTLPEPLRVVPRG
ncbi:polysaccharide pyruvyl transferase family protein [Kineosporia succinea]|uniref:Polysaccharide pyruvyl transferase domain-containing protein n=1 Tax=Kineosporia succinea TaxID=84632 RepID=A0ABT9P751_9ACTN|nr:polysaccharide pyruvyl transferase family protein [Kineosporia succinea]MDP9828272.1 hypothetical protein [Kineosporia succinea]